MSSPIAKKDKSKFDHTLINTHKKLSHNHRINILAREFSDLIKHIQMTAQITYPRILDVGCGDMTLAEEVANMVGNCTLQCTDIHPCSPELREQDARWSKYKQFNGKDLPFDNDSFDVLIFSDVLHHVPEEIRKELLTSAARIAKYVVIKDHFEYGWFSRQTLRAMDWVGNYSYGISIPEKYFDEKSFSQVLASANMRANMINIGLDLYNHLPIVRNMLSRNWHFFAICQKNHK
ncbi:MAG: hypothetical protein CVU21_05070 [Betaproteobacteria bacterium HGW-Betaproteobacteria-15]|nr:MAG: hypothetical protein CVU21_05070 [Betaproteobacteria bacterium HGW-Betaproteobacteria-15]